MSQITLDSFAEKKAEQAESLNAFSGIKLLHIKRNVATILSYIGRDGIFEEYTKHDISHINYMLNSLDWIIPEETKKCMTTADWLMIVLAIYFHDLGMLVTKEEFEKRDNSDFRQFKEDILNGSLGSSFKEKILSIKDPIKQDRFIYQELVRKTHAERIKYWIINEKNPKFNSADTAAEEIKNLLENLGYMFRRDLALVCESHHLSDLDNIDKYKINQPYGSDSQEEVNLHYSALILRTADLLHITSDRTPSIEYRLINPTDPISQGEWAKQRAVKKIRPITKKNKDGKPDSSLEKDTLEIVALFENEDGFFGLMSYLNYTNNELKINHRYHEIASEHSTSSYIYPWKFIDDSNIETKDFEKKQFEFTLDQTKILDLLVGHTLYNNQAVVFRELIQNSIDACRLKRHQLGISKNDYSPNVEVRWDSDKRQLSFIDNGTGMDLQIIQNHLLKVGSSRYQDDSFKKENPGFSPISRFGIGLLTCFLIADDIDIMTRTEKEDKAILLKIRKVHGKYLLKYVDASKSKELIPSHGTNIVLHVRHDVNLSNIEAEIRKWIIIPACKLTLFNDDKQLEIGFESPESALTSYLASNNYQIDEKKLKVLQFEQKGVQLAYALSYDEHFKEWNFLEFVERPNDAFVPIGVCIEGIRVDFNTPGFSGRNILAISNSRGASAPKTNVARSNIELTNESEAMLKIIYEIYLNHIQNELTSLRKQGFSLSWAAKEANYLLNGFVRGTRYNSREMKIQNSTAFNNALSQCNFLLTEKEKERQLINLNQLKQQEHFWTIDCASYLSADSLVKEVKGSDTSALSVMKTLYGETDAKIDHIDQLLCSIEEGNVIDNMILSEFQVDAIRIFPEQRRLDLRWSHGKEKLWEKLIIENDHRFNGICYIQLSEIDIPDGIEQIAIKSSTSLYILKNSELNEYLVRITGELNSVFGNNKSVLSTICGLVYSFFNYKDLSPAVVEEIIDYRRERNDAMGIDRILWNYVDKAEFISVISKTNFIKYDTTIWSRRFNSSLYLPF